MKHPILILNAGSSSLKFALYKTQADGTLTAGAHGQADRLTEDRPRLTIYGPQGQVLTDGDIVGRGHQGAIEAIRGWFSSHGGDESQLDGVGHRVVHGGQRFAAPVRIDGAVLAEIEALTPLAPLHQPHHVNAIRAISAIAPSLPQVACFDTAFHRTIPMIEREFALPRALTAQGVLRYGFHGLSYEYVAHALTVLDPQGKGRRTVVAHLGNGASLCALANGESVATTMGFTAVDGLMMGTRTGALDPGVVLYLLQHEKRNAAQIERLLYNESGLLGVSGIASDVRTLIQSAAPEAAHALDLFTYRAAREMGALAGVLGGLDTLVFTAGIGERAASVRAAICQRAAWLGVSLDEAANQANAAVISAPGSRVTVRVIPTDENLMIARHTRALLDARK